MQHPVADKSRTRLSPHSVEERPDSLLLDLYACPSAPARWPEVLDRFCAETGARSAVIQALHMRGSRLRQSWSVQDSHSRSFISPRAGRLADDGNPRLDARRVQSGVARLVRDEDLFTGDERTLHEFRAQLAVLGLGRFLGYLWQTDRDTYVSLALHRAAEDRGDFSARQLEWLTALCPHVSQAASLAQQLDAAASFNARLRRHFDQLRCGMMICDDDGHVHWANASAERLLTASHSLRLHAGSLLGRNPVMTEALLGEMVTVTATGQSSYLALGQGAQALHLALQPLAGETPSSPASVLLILTTPETDGPISAQALTRLFALTPAEARLVSGLVAGLSLEQYAQQRQVSLGTVRGQLKQVLAKTGAARQSELVRLVLSSAAAQIAQAAE